MMQPYSSVHKPIQIEAQQQIIEYNVAIYKSLLLIIFLMREWLNKCHYKWCYWTRLIYGVFCARIPPLQISHRWFFFWCRQSIAFVYFIANTPTFLSKQTELKKIKERKKVFSPPPPPLSLSHLPEILRYFIVFAFNVNAIWNACLVFFTTTPYL